MNPEETLNALVSQRQAGFILHPASIPEDVKPLLQAADVIAVWGTRPPSQAFAERLKTQLLAQAAAEGWRSSHSTETVLPVATRLGGNSLEVTANQDDSVVGPTMLSSSLRRFVRPHATRDAHVQQGARIWLPRWAALAAVLIVTVNTGFLLAGTFAQPGDRFYAVHRWEQSLGTTLALNAPDRVRFHLHNAEEGLRVARSIVMHGANESVYRDALDTFTQEEEAASAEIKQIPASAERDLLASQVTALQARAIRDLHGTLPMLSWPLRIVTTTVLLELGGGAPQVTQIALSGVRKGDNYVWTFSVTGSGFEPGAVLLVDGHPEGTVTVVAPTHVVAQLMRAEHAHIPGTVGIGNPDGTAVVTRQVTSEGDV